jgi:hypothetical protein
VERLDALVRGAQRVRLLARDGVDQVWRELELPRGYAVEFLRVRAHRRVTALAHVGEDLAHRLLQRGILRGVVACEGL